MGDDDDGDIIYAWHDLDDAERKFVEIATEEYLARGRKTTCAEVDSIDEYSCSRQRKHTGPHVAISEGWPRETYEDLGENFAALWGPRFEPASDAEVDEAIASITATFARLS